MKRILSLMRQAINEYNMIEENDKIAIAVSGGKDSMTLLEAMNAYRKFSPVKFDMGAIYADIGFEENASELLNEFCDRLGINLFVEKTIIKDVVFDINNTKSPCSLCSRMRRAALCKSASENGFNKIALGHTMDDALETFLMNIFYNSKTTCFEPITKYEDIDITIIRPLIFAAEKNILSYSRNSNQPVIKKLCPVDGKTDREQVKKLIKDFDKSNRNIKKNIFSAIKNLDEFKSKKAGE